MCLAFTGMNLQGSLAFGGLADFPGPSPTFVVTALSAAAFQLRVWGNVVSIVYNYVMVSVLWLWARERLPPERRPVDVQLRAKMFYNLLCLSACAFSLSLTFITEYVQRCNFAKRQETLDLISETGRSKDRAAALLVNILPGPVATRLQNSLQYSYAEGFSGAAACFMRLEGLPEDLSVLEKLAMLRPIFGQFDDLAKLCPGVEKIKTDENLYIAASGVSEPNSAAGINLVGFVKDAARLASRMHFEDDEGTPISFHLLVGMDLGPVVSGVIGSQRVRFDCFGNTMNMASRLCGKATRERPFLVGEHLVAKTDGRLLSGLSYGAPLDLNLKGHPGPFRCRPLIVAGLSDHPAAAAAASPGIQHNLASAAAALARAAVSQQQHHTQLQVPGAEPAITTPHTRRLTLVVEGDDEVPVSGAKVGGPPQRRMTVQSSSAVSDGMALLPGAVFATGGTPTAPGSVAVSQAVTPRARSRRGSRDSAVSLMRTGRTGRSGIVAGFGGGGGGGLGGHMLGRGPLNWAQLQEIIFDDRDPLVVERGLDGDGDDSDGDAGETEGGEPTEGGMEAGLRAPRGKPSSKVSGVINVFSRTFRNKAREAAYTEHQAVAGRVENLASSLLCAVLLALVAATNAVAPHVNLRESSALLGTGAVLALIAHVVQHRRQAHLHLKWIRVLVMGSLLLAMVGAILSVALRSDYNGVRIFKVQAAVAVCLLAPLTQPTHFLLTLAAQFTFSVIFLVIYSFHPDTQASPMKLALYLLGGGFVASTLRAQTETNNRKGFLLQLETAKQRELALVEEARVKRVMEACLPGAVLRDILASPTGNIPDREYSCSLLYCDIVSFTALSGQLKASELVLLLKLLFAGFERSSSQTGCECVKTMGDCYIAAAGCPEPCQDHADRIVRCGEAMLEVVNALNRSPPAFIKNPIQVRIGVATGRAVGGLLGLTSRLSYEVWGDVVTTAHLCEQDAKAMTINVHPSTQNQMADTILLQRHRGNATFGNI